MMRGRPKRYGETSQEERDVLRDINFARQIKPGEKVKSFRAIAKDKKGFKGSSILPFLALYFRRGSIYCR